MKLGVWKKNSYWFECGKLDAETQFPTSRYNQLFCCTYFYIAEMTLHRKIFFFFHLAVSPSREFLHVIEILINKL